MYLWLLLKRKRRPLWARDGFGVAQFLKIFAADEFTSMMPDFKRVAALAFFLLLGMSPSSLAQGVFTDSFNTNVNYLTNGVAGTIWDGVYFGAGEFNNSGLGGGGPGATIQCDANITAVSNLTLQTTGTAWEGADDDGFFLFKVVKGDFSAVVHVVKPFNNANFNTAGLQARAFSAGQGVVESAARAKAREARSRVRGSVGFIVNQCNEGST